MIKTLIEIIKEHKEYNKQIFKLAKSDLLKTYRGAALGWYWALIKPAFTIFVYWFAFEIGLRAGRGVNGYPFFLWLIAGIIPWFYMSEMLTKGIETIKKYSYLVTKIKFPISTIPTFVSLSKITVNIGLILILILIFWGFGYPPDIYLLQLPIYILFMYLFFTVFSLFGSMLASISRDFANLSRSLVTAVFWLSGIMWNINKLTIPWLRKVLMFNPVTFISNGFRNVFIDKIWFFEQPKRLMYMGIIFIILLILALVTYKKLKKEIPDVL
jgi:teichoic acid transport system permease protein